MACPFAIQGTSTARVKLDTWPIPPTLDADFISFFLDKYAPRAVLDFCGSDGELAFQAKLRGIYPAHASTDPMSCVVAAIRCKEFSQRAVNRYFYMLADALQLPMGDKLLDPARPVFPPGWMPPASDVPPEQQIKEVLRKCSRLRVDTHLKWLFRLLLMQPVRRSPGASPVKTSVEELVSYMRRYEQFRIEQPSFFNSIRLRLFVIPQERVVGHYNLCVTRPILPTMPRDFYNFMSGIVPLVDRFVLDVPASSRDMKAKMVKNVMASLGKKLVAETRTEEKRVERTTESTTHFVLEY